MDFLEFSDKEDPEGIFFEFRPLGVNSKSIYGDYVTKIYVNELGEDLEGYIPIEKTYCSCNSFKYEKKECKHITECIEVLKRRGVKVKRQKLVRYWCPNCKQEIQAVNDSTIVCSCGHEMIKSGSKKDESKKETKK